MLFLAVLGIYAGTILGFLMGLKEGGVESASIGSVAKMFGLATLFAGVIIAAPAHF